MPDLSRDETLAFLRSWPAKIAHVATARPDGTTASVPVWYRIDDGGAMLIWTKHERKWVQRVQRSGRLSFSVAEDAFPLRGAMGEGAAEVLGDGAAIDVTAERAAIIGRYVLPFLVPAYEASRAEHRAIIRVALDRLTGWSFDES
ncbi:MAG: pyridoxamine 5'-phosphate oxidase family protein [Gaiellales bacterium]